MNSITQDMKYKQSLVKYALQHGVSKASRKYNRCRSFIYFWLKRYDGSIESLACKPRRPHHHPLQHTDEELKLIGDMRKRNSDLGLVEFWCRLRARGYTRCITSLYRVMKKKSLMPSEKPKKKKHVPKPYEQMTRPGERIQIDVKIVPKDCCVGDAAKQRLYQYTAIDEHTRLRYLAAFEEQNTYSSTVFLTSMVSYFKRYGITVQCVQSDNGPEFTNRFVSTKRNTLSLFEQTAAKIGIRHKLIKPYTPRHNGKVERSHREDMKRFYGRSVFYSFQDFEKQLAVHMTRSNKIPMRPLGYLSPREFLANYYVQDV